MFLVVAQVLYSVSEQVPGDPFLEPYVSASLKGHAVDVGWPIAFANCLDSDEKTYSESQGPWTKLFFFTVLKISWLAIVLDFLIILISALTGTALAIFIVDRVGLQFSCGLFLTVLSIVAMNLMTQNNWLIRHDSGIIAKTEFLIRSFFSYLTWTCMYSICFVFVFPREKTKVSATDSID